MTLGMAAKTPRKIPALQIRVPGLESQLLLLAHVHFGRQKVTGQETQTVFPALATLNTCRVNQQIGELSFR